MGCCVSSRHQPENPNPGHDDHHDAPRTNVNPPHNPPWLPPPGHTGPLRPPARRTAPSQPPAEGTVPSQPPGEGTTTIRQYNRAELVEATNGFCRQSMVSRGGGQLRNFVYRGRLRGGQEIAIKRFSQEAWPDVEMFREEAIKAGRFRHRRLVKLIGYCCERNERLLVAEFMPYDTLATHLFGSKFKIMEWSMRLRVACYIAEALDYCINEAQVHYHDLSSNKVLFDEAGNLCLSCFGLVKNGSDARCLNTNISYMSPDCVAGRTTHESMIYNFGIVLVDLLSGKQIPQDKAVELLLGISIPTVTMDSRLNGEYSPEGATALEELACECLRRKAKDRPTIKDVIATLAQVQSNAAGPSNAMPGTEAS